MINDRNNKSGTQAGINNPQKNSTTPGQDNPVKDNPKMDKGVNKSGANTSSSAKFPQR